MLASFIELPAFQRWRDHYFDDAALRVFQQTLMTHPEAGRLIKGTGGLRKIRWTDPRRGKGKRGGLRVIYFWDDARARFWLFTVYDKGEADDLTGEQRHVLKQRLAAELAARRRDP